MKCKVCNNDSDFIFKKKILDKYTVSYFQCPDCFFIQTDSPFWLDEAYSDPISCMDVGLISRNISLSKEIEGIITRHFDYKNFFLDYGGGYGIFVRLMRDAGLNFYRYDKFCVNLFSKYFDLEDYGKNEKFECLTAIEVFEHLEDPIEEIKKMFTYSDSIIFTTELNLNKDISSLEKWWYFVPEEGQHISFYTLKTFEVISKMIDCKFISNGFNLHILTKNKNINNVFEIKRIKQSFSGKCIILFTKILSEKKVNSDIPKLNSLIIEDFEKIIKIKQNENTGI